MTVHEAAGIAAVRADGGPLRIRPVGPGDLAALRPLQAAASDRSMYLPFFSLNRPVADKYLAILVQPPSRQHRTLAAFIDDDLVGVAGSERLDDDTAEVALLVADEHHHQGIGTLLLERLVTTARADGVRRFVAEVLSENAPMIEVFRDLGLPVRTTFESGNLHLVIDLSVGMRLLRATEGRKRTADAARAGQLPSAIRGPRGQR